MPPWAVDTVVCGIAVAATVYRIGTGVREPGDQIPDAQAYAIGIVMALALLGRRYRPTWVLGAVALLWLAYHVLDYPGGAPAVPVWVALYSAAAAERRRAALAVAGALIVSDALARTGQTEAGLFDAVLDGSTVVFVAALLLGEAVRSRRAWRAEFEARLAMLAAERERAAARRVAEERLRMARELHDVSAHTIAVINVQAGVAAELLTESPQRAGEAIEAVRRAGREAMAGLRAAIGVLRDPGDPAVTVAQYGRRRTAPATGFAGWPSGRPAWPVGSTPARTRTPAPAGAVSGCAPGCPPEGRHDGPGAAGRRPDPGPGRVPSAAGTRGRHRGRR